MTALKILAAASGLVIPIAVLWAAPGSQKSQQRIAMLLLAVWVVAMLAFVA
jgi:hypothetical protein